jgi:hypothetical protein
VTTGEIAVYNNPTFKPQGLKTQEEKMRYQEFLDEQDAVFQDKNATIDDILKFSK